MPEGNRPAPFVHLHVHTHYSLLDGANRIDELVDRSKEHGAPAVAITDHGNLFGVIEFYQTATKAGIKPILGMEAYIAPGDRRSRESEGKETNYHLLLLAQSLAGYRNLLKLSSIAYKEGFYYKPRIDREVLEAHSDGLICTSTCLGAEIPQALMNHNRQKAEEISDWYLKVFGPERFFIELQDHGLEEQRQINPELIEIASRKGLGLVVTNDVHYLTHDDVEAHDVLCCISTRALKTDENRFKFPSDQFFLKTPDEMARLFPALPEAMSNTVRIAEMCNVELDFSKRYTPVYRPPAKKSDKDYLREQVYKGAAERFGTVTDEIRERIDYELDVIQSKGFSSYFLICWDLVHYARAQGIPCAARGSGCSSIVAYCLYLSQPDPLRYGLYFERFMDPDRDEMPDIDIDICQDGRERVIQYVREKYGHVAQIITFGTLKARAAIRDVCRVLGVDLATADRVAKLVPEELKMTLDKALNQEPELKRFYDEDPKIREVIDVARRIEGLARHPGIHAAGVVIADEPLDNLLPLYKPSNSDAVVTQFEGPTVEKVGLLKMDFLGLKTLSVLARCCQLAREQHGVEIDVERLDLTDQRVYQLFARGETKGVFQFESGGMRDVLMKMRPNRIEDLIAANALYRPGPMVNIDAYVARKHGEPWTTPHEQMTEVLAETYGIIVYQEQVARLAIQLGDIERKRAFRLAKAISKKKTAAIEAEREPFVKGSVGHGVNKKVAEDIFNQILPFGEYAFNKAHSTGYAIVAFQTGYLKTYYPIEFMAALLTYDSGDTDQVVEYMDECKRLEIDVRPPDVNSSNADFTIVKSEADPDRRFIRFGLGAIKGVGLKAVDAITAARREGGPFENLYDFCERVDPAAVNRGVLEALIKAGAFDSTGAMRKALIDVLDQAMQAGAAAQRDKLSGQMSLFGGAGPADQKPRVHIPTEEWSEAEMLAHEKSVLGFYITKHPLAAHAETLSNFATITCAEVLQRYKGQQLFEPPRRGGNGAGEAEVVLGGMIAKVRTTITKSGQKAGSKLAILNFEDLTGGLEAVVYSEVLEQFHSLIKPDRIVFLRGIVDRRREDPSIRVSEIITLEEGPIRLAEAVIVGINALGMERTLPNRLRDICQKHRGDRPLYVQVRSANQMATMIACGDRYAIRPDDAFVRAVETLLGANSVAVVGRRRTHAQPAARQAAAPHVNRTSLATEIDEEAILA